MATKYKNYGKNEFEYRLRGIFMRNKLNYKEVYNATEELSTLMPILEFVYRLPTKSRAVDILLYSSVDVRTSKTREIGADAVRVVMRWNITKRNTVTGEVISSKRVYKHVAKHLRIETLFQNIEKTVLKNYDTSSGMLFNEFTSEEDFIRYMGG
jgi:hypothetical protein